MNTPTLHYRLLKRLYQGRCSTVSRVLLAGHDAPVIIKQLDRRRCPAEAPARLRHEFELLAALDLDGVPRVLDHIEHERGSALLFTDREAHSLRQAMRPGSREWHDWLALMIRVCERIGRLHEARVIHKQINPDHILVTPTGDPLLIDFGMATRFLREQASWNTPQLASHRLPYIAPEQSGRINRAIDYRTDYYSFGATLYELLTGQPPFAGREGLELVHCHIAHAPRPPHHINRLLPEAVSAVVLKLLAKDASERYQSAHGIVHDLRECLQRRGGSADDAFTLASRDVSARFQIPQRLYGRDALLAELEGQVEACTAGAQAIVLISGYTGVGKSTLVHELRRAVLERNGRFASGKFDQYRRNPPHSALLQALRELIRQHLTAPAEHLAALAARLQAQLGGYLGTLLRLLPELGLIVGDAAPPPTLQQRFDEQGRLHLFTRLLDALSDRNRPLTLFLDDLQWADPASLGLIESLAARAGLPHLLLVGSYRHNEITPAHVLAGTLERLRDGPLTPLERQLQPLDALLVRQLLADTLRCSEVECSSLAEVCHEKTQGNPFFLSQFLNALYEEGLIRFHGQRWEWDEAAIRARALSADVVELMVGRLRRLPAHTRGVLPLAACIGNTFDLDTLSIVGERPARQLARELLPALGEGLIVPLDDGCRAADDDADQHGRYRFAHDRVQQAAYSLLADDAREQLHLRVGRLLRQNLETGALDRRVFEIAGHLNLARSAIADPDERIALATLNLCAGLRARESAAFESALDYLESGLQALPADAWRAHHRLALDLHLAAADAANSRGDTARMQALLDTAERHAHDPLDRVRCQQIRIQAHVAHNRFAAGLELARRTLGMLGVDLPAAPARRTITAELLRTRLLVRSVDLEALIGMPIASEAQVLAAQTLLGGLFGIVKFSSSALRPLVMARQVELALGHGHTDASAPALAGFGGVLCGVLGAIDEGYRAGSMALALEAARPSRHSRHKSLSLFNCYVRHYREPLPRALAGLHEAHAEALACGDLEYAAYSLAAAIQYAVPLAEDLRALARDMRRQLLQLEQTGQKQSLQYSYMALQALTRLCELSAMPTALDGEHYREASMLAEHRRENHLTAVCLHHFYKALLALVFADYPGALAECALGEAHLPYVGGTHTATWFRSLHALALLRTLPPPGAGRERALRKLRAIVREVRAMATHAPANHAHRVALIEAEHLRLHDRPGTAAAYDRAIALAESNGFWLDAALACEFAARFHLDAGARTVARAGFDDVCRRYERLGAHARIAHLQEQLEEYGLWARPAAADAHGGAQAAADESNQSFDIASVIKASQAISDEIVLERLLERLMQLALASAGAQRGALALRRDQRLYVEAIAGLEEASRLMCSLALESAAASVPVSVLNYVARTGEALVLGDATRQQMFAHDAYICAHAPHSLLCMPILYHGELTALLYLEHRQSRDIFDHQRLKTLQILAAQAAISIENAKLYLGLQQSEQAYRSLYENAIEGIFRVDPEGRFLSANPALVGLLGHAGADEFLAGITDVSTQCFVHAEDQRRFLGRLNMAEKVVGFETRWRRRDGSAIEVSISARRVLDDSGRLLYYEGSLTDIGERKAKERAELARERAEAASRAKSDFLAAMSHEIRTPMNGILGMAQLLARSVLEPGQREWVEAIGAAGKTLLAILDDVLDFSKIEAGQLVLDSAPFSPAEALAALRPILMSMTAQKGLALRFELDPALPAGVLGDRRALHQIVLNLAGNAVKFTQRGFVAVRASALAAAGERCRLRLEVADSGIGIAEDAQQRIFTEFTQADGSITRRFGGTGLGLAICLRLAELQGGRIGVRSRPGAGSVFWCELEYASAPAPCAAPPRPALTANSRGLRVLVVEDVELNRCIAGTLLEAEGHRVRFAADGYGALEAHEREDFDVVLLDIHLPDLDGMEVARRIRRHPEARKAGVRIIALTASVTTDEVRRYREAGMDAVVGKPFDFDALMRTLEDGSAPSSSASPAPVLLDTELLGTHFARLGKARMQPMLELLGSQGRTQLGTFAAAADPEHQRAHLHQLAGMAANFGLSAFAARCQALERSPHPTDLRVQAAGLQALLEDSLRALDEFRPLTSTT
ncbi:AAA family ATPase [Thauera sp.]|uniref:AAA family ATPase n=1 Tax=Thauera sp. TaxID=1905334 RepID=UPI002615EE0F|nr:AAA family ATPase [Thauera sp.]MCK6408031.1 AAA family ATPase [Thauera sp.]